MSQINIDSYSAKQCEVVTRWNNDPTKVGMSSAPSIGQERRIKQGILFEENILVELSSYWNGQIRDLRTLPRDERLLGTQDALSKNTGLILGSVLPRTSSGRVGSPDILVHLEDGWTCIDVKNHQLLKPGEEDILTSTLDELAKGYSSVTLGLYAPAHTIEDVFQLAQYQMQLTELGLANNSGCAGILENSKKVVWINLNGPRLKRVEKSFLEEYIEAYLLRVKIAEQELLRISDVSIPSLVEPINQSECDECQWRGVCGPILLERDSISLLPGLNKLQAKKLIEAGIRTRAQLGQVDLLNLPVDPNFKSELWTKWHDSAVSGYFDEIFLHRDALSIDVPRADIEIDIDMESYDDRVYLWGIYVTNKSSFKLDNGFIDRFSNFEELIDENSEIELFQKFWSWLSELHRSINDEGLSVKYYVYSGDAAEYKHIRRLSKHLLTSLAEDEIEEFLTSESWVDLRKVVEKSLVSPTNYKLKTVAVWAGHKWRNPDPGGDQSQVWYEQAVNGLIAADRKRKQEVLEYNEDDVLATKFLREWLDTANFRSIASVSI